MFSLTQCVQAIILSTCNQNNTIQETFCILFLCHVSEIQCAFYVYSAAHCKSATFQLLRNHTWLMATTLEQPGVKSQSQAVSLKFLNFLYWDYKICFTETKWDLMKIGRYSSFLLWSVKNGLRGQDIASFLVSWVVGFLALGFKLWR